MAYNYIHFVGKNICVISSALQLHSLALKANQILWRRYSACRHRPCRFKGCEPAMMTKCITIPE